MKNFFLFAPRLLWSSALLSVPLISALAAENDSTVRAQSKASTAAPAANTTAPAAVDTFKASNSTSDVVKLSRSQVSDDIILSYVQNSGKIYSLSSDDIIALRKEGVSDRVIHAMLDKHGRAVEAANVGTTPATQPAPAPAQPAVVEAPLTPAGSTVHVIPYEPSYPPYGYNGYYPYYSYYAYYPYYSRPYCYGGPVVSFRFGFYGGHGHHHR